MESVLGSVDAAISISLVPRRGPALPSPDGTYYVATGAHYNAKASSQEVTTTIWKVGTREPYFTLPHTRKLDPDSTSWLSGSVLLWAEPAEDRSPVYTLDVKVPSQKYVLES